MTAWNPSFDVTPSSLIRGIVTELGVIDPSSDSDGEHLFAVSHFLSTRTTSSRLLERISAAAKPVAVSSKYAIMVLTNNNDNNNNDNNDINNTIMITTLIVMMTILMIITTIIIL